MIGSMAICNWSIPFVLGWTRNEAQNNDIYHFSSLHNMLYFIIIFLVSYEKKQVITYTMTQFNILTNFRQHFIITRNFTICKHNVLTK